ncbi:hypothetical protein BDV25DRAFT_151132 [Aspergillus avenaceus]|uniref:S-adenosyl-L-methionine-dependent methyltransferase n=1 Tax=Aspergillus avenaceus TaxID=36643 RepID=A0A5N6U1H4_ASPAV|nr:hypothetical protein BDV25DRAFT_151132 [Aspergillus avenaceus]
MHTHCEDKSTMDRPNTATLDGDNYLLIRDSAEDMRLHCQHLIWELHTQYILSPDIPVTEHMRIADIGAGNGVWPFHLSQKVPSTVQIDGYDISSASFPPPSTLPQNVKLDLLNALSEPPESLRGVYDVVHVRLWCFVIRGNDPDALVRTVGYLLKPGEYIQWEDVCRDAELVQPGPTQTFENAYTRFLQRYDINMEWVRHVPERLRDAGFEVIRHSDGPFEKLVEAMYFDNYVSAALRVLGADETVAREAMAHIVQDLSRRGRDDIRLPFRSLALVARSAGTV